MKKTLIYSLNIINNDVCKIINERDNMDDEEMKKLEEDGKEFLKTIEEIYARC